MATISDTPWSEFTAADYTPQQWRRACIVHLQPAQGQDPDTKGLHKVPVREPSGTINRNGVHAAAGGHGLPAVKGAPADVMMAAAKELARLYGEIGDPVPPGIMNMAGMSSAGMGRSREWFDRSYPLEGIEILSRAKGGDGRTVEAYAAVFDVPQEIHDQHGDYTERIARAAFNMTINSGAAKRALALYNHGMNVIDGKPNIEAQVPLGSPLEIRADGKGLLTITRYNRSALSDSVLEAIRNGDIRAQSFRGRIYRSDPMRVPKTRPGQPLPTVTRMELGLSDYGPTPRAYYDVPMVVAVRAAQDVFSDIAGLDEAERAELFRMMLATTRLGEPEPGTATSIREAGTEEPRKTHSGRQQQLRLFVELARMELALHAQAPK